MKIKDYSKWTRKKLIEGMKHHDEVMKEVRSISRNMRKMYKELNNNPLEL